MQGTKHKARKHMADGGAVFGSRGLAGLRDMIPAVQAMGYQQQAAPVAAPVVAPAPVAAPAVPFGSRGIAGLKAMIPQVQAMGYKNGGIVHGPGTGTSDDIPDEMREGSYVLPADTTAKTVGPQTDAMLNQMQAGAGGAPRGLPMGKKVPVQLSNGETKLTPEDVHAIGAQALDALKGATHTPAARGMPANIPGGQQDQTRMFFAEGGAVTEEERLRRQTEAYVAGAQAAAAAQPAPAPVVPLEQRVAQIPAGAPTPAPVVPQQPLAGRVAQIPTGGQVAPPVPAPAAPAPTNYPNTAAVARGAMEDTSAAWQAGNPAQAAGSAVRGLVTTGPTAVAEGLYNVVAPVASGVASFARGLTGTPAPAAAPAVQPQAPASVAQPAPVQQADTAPVSAPMAVKSAVPPGPVGLDGVRPGDLPVVDQQVAPGVYRQGNSYGDSPAAAAAGAAPRGLPSAQNNAAAQALAERSQAESVARVQAPAARGIPGVQAGTVPNTGNNWQARNDMRNLEVSAASITNNGGRFDATKGNNAAQAALKNAQAIDLAARGAQPVLDRAAMDANANLQREGMQQQGGIDRENIQQGGANTRAARGLAVDRARLNVDASRAASENAARDVATSGAQQLQQLRNVLLDPATTPEQRKQAESSLRAIGGKAEAANRFTVVPGGQEVSPQGVAFTRPSMVLNNQTGEIVGQNAPAAPQGGAARPASKAEYDALPKGTQYVGPDGKIKIKG